MKVVFTCKLPMVSEGTGASSIVDHPNSGPCKIHVFGVLFHVGAYCMLAVFSRIRTYVCVISGMKEDLDSAG